jgi:hypothetical protein
MMFRHYFRLDGSPASIRSLAIVTEYVKEGLVESICFVHTENLIITITSGFRFSVHTTGP